MKKMALVLCPLILCTCSLDLYSFEGHSFYVDTENGDMSNDGSFDHPWKSLQSVCDDKVETRAYKGSYSSGTATLQMKKEGAPVKAGDRIVLRSGSYGKLTIQAAYNSSPITIIAESGAAPQFTRIIVKSASNWKLSGLKISASNAATPALDTLYYVSGDSTNGPASDITLENCELSSIPDSSSWTSTEWNSYAANGIEAYGDNIIIRKNTIKNVNFGIQVNGTNCSIQKNVISDFCGDGMRGFGSDLLFEYNTVKNCHNVNDNHCDAFQSWPNPSTPERIVLRGNTILQWDATVRPSWAQELQGFGIFGGPFKDWRIENNVVITSFYHGITLLGGVNCLIVNNSVIDEDPTDDKNPWIENDDGNNAGVFNPTSGCTVRNNVAPAIMVSSNTVSDFNVVAKAANYNSLFESVSTFNLKPCAGSCLIDQGFAKGAPSIDHVGIARPRGLGIDIGAYER